MTADLEFGTTGDHTTAPRPGPALRSPAMSAYCATLARFTSSVQSTEQLLRNDEAGTREDTEQREQTAATRLRGIDRAVAAADDGLAHCAAVRSEYGLPPASAGHTDDPPADAASAGLEYGAPADPDHRPFDVAAVPGYGPAADGGHLSPGAAEYGRPSGPDDTPSARGDAAHADPEPGPGPNGHAAAAARSGAGLLRRSADRLDDPAPALDRLRRTGGADLGVALTALGRRRDELKLAETEFVHWLEARDEQSRRVTLGATVAAGLAGAAIMAIAGTRMSAATALVLLMVCTLGVVAAGLGVAAARRLPRVCQGAGLARRPDGRALAKYGARIGGVALAALTAANIAGGAL